MRSALIKMDVSSPVTPHYDSLTESSSEFQSDAYLEYRSRVLAQLAEEKKIEASRKAYKTSKNKDSTSKLADNTSVINSSGQSGYEDDDIVSSDKSIFDSQPSWDDSDINFDNSTKWHGVQTDPPTYENLGKTVSDQFQKDATDESNSLITWTSVDEHISKNAIGRSNSSDALSSLDLDFSRRSPSQRMKRRSSKRNSMKRKKYEKEKHSLFDDENEKMQYSSRPERSYSAGNQSLQICYINQSCSSDDAQSDTETKGGFSAELVSPIQSPRMALPRYSNRFLLQQRLSDSSLSSMSSSGFPSSQPSAPIPENTIIMYPNVHHDSKLTRTKQEQLEIDTRYELARAHQQAKVKAEEMRNRKTLQEKDSITLKLLKATLSDSTSQKLKTFSLSREECMQLRLSHLKLILNEMQTVKSELNNELVSLLLSRDELKTEQDGKLVEVEDVKSIIVSVGPETTV